MRDPHPPEPEPTEDPPDDLEFAPADPPDEPTDVPAQDVEAVAP